MATAMPSDSCLDLRSPEHQLAQSQLSANLSRFESNIATKHGVKIAEIQHEMLSKAPTLDQETTDFRILRAPYASGGTSESVQRVVLPMVKRKPVNEASIDITPHAPTSTEVPVDHDLEEEIEVTERLRKKATITIASGQFGLAERVLIKVLRRYQGLAVQYPTKDFTPQLASTHMKIADTLEKQERYTESLASLYAASHISPTEVIATRIIEGHIKMKDYTIALSLATDTLTHRRGLYRKDDERRNEILALKIRILLLQDEYDEAEAYYESMPSASMFYADLKHHFSDQEAGTIGSNPSEFQNKSSKSISELPDLVQNLRSLDISQPPKLIENLQSLSGPVPRDSMSVPPLQNSSMTDSLLLKVDDAGTSVIKTIATSSGTVCAVVFSPDGKQIASGSGDRTMKLWNATTGNLQKTFTGHSDWVRAVAFSPDGKQIASASDDQTVKLWSFATGDLVKTLTGHSDWVFAVTFSPDGKQVASGSKDWTIKLWDATQGNL